MIDDELDDRDDGDPIDVKYQIYTDDPSKTVYVKFGGFDDVEQMNAFAEYIEESLPLLLFNSETKH